MWIGCYHFCPSLIFEKLIKFVSEEIPKGTFFDHTTSFEALSVEMGRVVPLLNAAKKKKK